MTWSLRFYRWRGAVLCIASDGSTPRLVPAVPEALMADLPEYDGPIDILVGVSESPA